MSSSEVNSYAAEHVERHDKAVVLGCCGGMSDPSTLYKLLVMDFVGTNFYLFEFEGCSDWRERSSP